MSKYKYFIGDKEISEAEFGGYFAYDSAVEASYPWGRDEKEIWDEFDKNPKKFLVNGFEYTREIIEEEN